MALAGLRPLRETNALGDAPAQGAVLDNAYQIFVQENYDSPDANQTYYASKWLRLPAGMYEVSVIMDGYGRFKLDGNLIRDNLTNGGSPVTPAVFNFLSRQSTVYKLDLEYVALNDTQPAYIIYRIKSAETGAVMEVSRANDFVGDIVPIEEKDLPPKPSFNQEPRLAYPVFLPQPNWADEVSERFSWLTDVLSSESQAEQRRRLREKPRHSIEASFLTYGIHRNLMDAFLTSTRDRYCLVPLWYDESMVRADIEKDGNEVTGDFAGTMFRINDVVIIRRPDNLFDFETNIVRSVSDDKINLVLGVQEPVPFGSTITPMRVAQVTDSADVKQHTDEVTETAVRFEIQELPTFGKTWKPEIYKRTGLPVLNVTPNYREISNTYEANIIMFDSNTGPNTFAFPGGQTRQYESFSYHLHGRAEVRSFLEMVNALGARWKSFHVSTERNEFALKDDIRKADGAIKVEVSGYSMYDQDEQRGRRDIMIETYTGDVFYNTIISSRTMRDTEWLFLAESPPDILKNNVRRVSFMPISRLDSDNIEIRRKADSYGHSIASLVVTNIPTERKIAT